jgi:pimeloyl-ACP methyl ester carboxylesterase
MITGSTHNQLEILDWGGKGIPILFLTGLSNTAHVYDHFAPGFTDQFQVYGMSRRGYGKSEQTKDGYGIDTLANDILEVLNTLKIDKVILIGHSIAGDEITTFATKYPGRVSHIIYLDAAYDHINLPEPFPEFPKKTNRDSSSVSDFNLYLKRIRGFTFPEEEIKNQYEFDEKGKLVKNITPWSIGGAIVDGVRLPSYKSIQCSALAIYGQRNTAEEWFPSLPLMDSVNQRKAIKEFMPEWKKYYDGEMKRFQTEMVDGTVKEITGADHYIFLTHPKETENIIRSFIKKKIRKD